MRGVPRGSEGSAEAAKVTGQAGEPGNRRNREGKPSCPQQAAMDTTLAVIAKFSGREMSFVAVISGLILTLAAPLLISMIYRFL